MKVLTEEEITEEAGFIRDEQMWPFWPVLPVKNINRGEPGYPEGKGHGVMVAGHGPKVYLTNLYALVTGSLAPQLKDKPVLEFDSLEALVEAGWIGD